MIVDASMPAMIRNGGKMWNAKGEAQDTLAVLPDSTYARIYQVVIDFCKKQELRFWKKLDFEQRCKNQMCEFYYKFYDGYEEIEKLEKKLLKIIFLLK